MLSIVIPNYNYARYLPTCLDSILAQEDPDFEIVVVDDGSQDESPHILEHYASKYPQVRPLLCPKNQGVFHAASLGLEQARGKYLHFFSADDRYLPGFLSQVRALFEKQIHLNLVCTDFGYFRDGDERLEEQKLLPECSESACFSSKDLLPLFQRSRFWIPGVTCVFKIELMKTYGMLDARLENISDWFYFHRIALFEGIGYIPQVLVAMRQHDHTYTSRVKRDKKRRRATYHTLLQLLASPQNQTCRHLFAESGLLDFVFTELYWRLFFNPRYRLFWPYLIKKRKALC